MKEYIIENISSCCDAFQDMLLEDKYLSRRDLDRFLDRYKDTFPLINKGYINHDDILYIKIVSIVNEGIDIIKRRNDVYIKRKMKELSSYFDDMFLDVDDSIKLDNEQRKSIISDEDYSLIVAPPGTGKTTVAIAKIKYLVEKQNVDPSTIMFVCSSKRKSRELKDIINGIFNTDVNVLTVEDLAIDLLSQTYGDQYSISGFKNLYKLIFGYIKNIVFPNKEKLEIVLSSFSHKVEYKNDYFNYSSFNDYYEEYINKEYLVHKNNIDSYLDNKINSFISQYKSIKGEMIRTIEEVKIANYLFLHGLDYEYYVKENIDDYVADFIVNVNGKNYYIEYYGLTSVKEDGTVYIKDTNLKRNLKIKQSNLRKKYGDNLIELYNDSDYLITLEEELLKKNIVGKNITKKEIFTTLLESEKENEFKGLVDLISKFIKRFIEKGYSLDDFDLLIRNQYIDKIRKQLIIIRDIFEYYTNYLINNNMVDLNSLYIKVTNSLDKLKHDNKNKRISYLIMDDYQNMSNYHNLFAKKLSTIFNSKIVALGDDWELLYALGEKDLDVFRDFCNVMGYTNIMRISNSYRSSQDIIDITSSYLGKNYDVLSRSIISSNNMNKPLEVYYYSKNNIYEKYIALENALSKIYKNNKNAKILITSNCSKSINEYIDAGYFRKGKDGLLVSTDYPKASIEYHSINETKGMEYDQVILLSQQKCYLFLEEDDLMKLLDGVKNEMIDNPEDRRLFYIALTRTKNKLYIISPVNVLPFK